MVYKASVQNPEECAKMFGLMVDRLIMYAQHQEAIAKRNYPLHYSKECMIRAEVYRGIAQEMREIEWTKEPELKPYIPSEYEE